MFLKAIGYSAFTIGASLALYFTGAVVYIVATKAF